MKKLLLIAVAAMAAFTTKAATRQYTDKLTVTMNDVPSVQDGEIVIETLDNGNITVTLKNFVYESAGIPVGNITVENVKLNEVTGKYAGQFKSFSTVQNVNITAGSKAGIDGWYGPSLGPLEVGATGQITDEKFYANFAIDVTAFYGDKLYVEVGEAMNVSHYDDYLTVTINGDSSDPIAANVIVETLENGNINFVLKNFALNADIRVGNIRVNDLELTPANGYSTFSYKGEINITPGDLEGVDASSYVGPIISPVPIDMQGKINDEKAYLTIDIDMMELLSQTIYVVFGTDIPEGGDAIQAIDYVQKSSQPVYDLSGRRVSLTHKGLYIIDGRKVVK